MDIKKIINICLFLLLPLLSYGKGIGNDGEEIIIGNVTDSEGNALQGIIVRLYDNERLKAYSTSSKDGSFTLKTDSINYPAKIVFLSNMYEKMEVAVTNGEEQVRVSLQPEAYMLREVTVKVPHVRVKGDTITYDVASYTNKGDTSIEDVIKKLPGVAVEENGTITYDGEPINNFYIEGLNLMGGNYSVATRNIRPEDISSVSVYERHQPKRVLKNIRPSKKAALNLKLKKSRMIKPVGYLQGGAGAGEELLWGGGMYGMFISPRNQTIIQGNGNNNGINYYSPRPSEDAATSVFSQTPFGTPSISQNRYLFNKSAYFTANTLYSPKKDFTVTLNTAYSLDHSSYQGSSVTEYLGSEAEGDMIYSEQLDNRLRNHVVTANAKIERNNDKFFFSDQISFGGSFANNDYEILSKDITLQNYDADYYNFANMLSTIVKHNKKIYEIESTTIYRRSPLNRMAATDATGKEITVRQNTSGHSFYNKESTSFSRLVSTHGTLGVGISFEANTDKFLSDGISDENIHSDNDVAGYRITTSAKPFYIYSKQGKMSVEISLPVRLLNLKYTDLLTDEITRLDKVFVDMNASIFFKINPFQHSDVAFGWDHSHGNIKDFILNPVYTTYRNTMTLGTGELNESLSKYIQGSYTYSNPLEGLYGNVAVSYNRKDNNTLSVYDVSESGTSQSSVAHKSRMNTSNLMLNLTKNVRQWNTSFSLSGTGVFMTKESRRSAMTLNVRNNVYILTGKIETHQFNDILGLTGNVSYTYSAQDFEGVLPSTNLNEVSTNCKVSVFPVAKFEIFSHLIYNRSKIAEGTYKGNLFIDAGARYNNKKYEISLSAKNLSNSRQYSYTLYRTLDMIAYSYSLRPIEFMLSFRYNF